MKSLLKTLLLAAVVCLPWAVKAQSLSCANGQSCQLTIEMWDGYGDGWDYASVEVYQGSTLRGSASMEEGDLNGTTATIDICGGDSLRIAWNPGPYSYEAYPEEIAFIVYDAAGDVLFTCDYGDAELYSSGQVLYAGLASCPSCRRPVALAVSAIDSAEMTLSWTPAGDESGWNVLISDTAVADFDEWMPTAVSDTFYTFTGLATNSPYYLYVQADCGSELSGWSLLSARTACGATALPYTENFDLYFNEEVPACWTVLTPATFNGFGNPCVDSYTGHLGDGCLSLYDYAGYQSSQIENMIATPPFADINTLQVSFWAKTQTYCDPDLFSVGVTDPNQVYHPVDTLELTTDWQYFTVYFDQYEASEGGMVTFYATATGWDIEMHVDIDEVTVSELSNCRYPTGLRVTDVTSSSVALAWNDDLGSTWQVAYGPAGFTPDDDWASIETGIGDVEATIYDLSDTVIYDFYVRTDCGGEQSVWFGPVQAMPGVYCMGATGSDTLVSCGVTIADNGGVTANYSANCNSILVLYPEDEGQAVRLRGSVHTYSGTTDGLYLYEGVGTAGRSLGVYRGVTSVDTVSNIGPMTLRFTSGTAANSSYNGVDCIGFQLALSCEEMSGCPAVTDLAVSDITGTSATLTWYTASEVDDFTVAVYDSTGAPYSTATATGLSYVLSGLQPTSDWTVSVVANCANGDNSEPATAAFATVCLSGGDIAIDPEHASATGTNANPLNGNYNYSLSQNLYTASDLARLGDTIFGIAFYQTNDIQQSRNITVYLDTTSLASFNAVSDYVHQDSTTQVYSGAFSFAGEGWQYIPFDQPVLYHGTGLLVTVDDNSGSWSSSFPYFKTIPHAAGEGSIYTYDDDDNPDPSANLPLSWNTSTAPNKAFITFRTECGQASCIAPALRVEEVGSDEITIAWVPGYQESAWSVEYRPADGTWTMASASETSTQYTFTNLAVNQTYEFRVSSLCGDEEASATLSARTACVPVTQLPFGEDFENFYAPGTLGSGIESCWNRHHTSTATAYPYVSEYYGNSGSHSIYFNGTYEPYLVLPAFATGIDSLVFTAKALRSSAWGLTTIDVGVMTDPANAGTFQSVASFNLTEVNEWQSLEVAFPGLSGTGYHIAVTCPATATGYLDDILVQRASMCGRVENPAVATTTTTATVTWADTNEVGDYSVRVSDVNDVNAAIDSVDVSAASATLTGLTPGSYYYAWIRTNCPDEASWWTPTGRFSTECLPVDSTWVEGFESAENETVPLCWESLEGYDVYPSVVEDAGEAHQGTKCLYLVSLNYGVAYSANSLIATPRIDDMADLQMSFYAATVVESYENYTPEVFAVGAVDSLGNFTGVDTISLNGTYQPFTVYLARYAQYGDRVGFLCSAATDMMGAALIDDISLAPAAGCPAPSNLAVASVGTTAATLAWSENGQATQWEVSYDDGQSANAVVASANPFTVTGLTPGTAYTFQVRAICGAGDTSDWSLPAAGATECLALAQFPLTEGFEGGEMPACWRQVFTNGTHAWEFDLSGTESSNSGVTSTHGGSYNAAFSHTNRGTSTMLVSPVMDLTVLATPYLSFWHAQPEWSGDQDELKLYYRVSPDSAWVQLAYYQNDIADWTEETFLLPNPSAEYQIAFEAFDDYGYGVVLDDIYVGNAPTCAAVTGLVPVGMTTTTVTLDWTDISENPDGYIVEYGAPGFALGTGTAVAFTSHPATVGGLTQETEYQFYVRPVCVAGQDTGFWSRSVTVATTRCDDNCLLAIEMADDYADSWNGAAILFSQGSYTQEIAMEYDDFTASLLVAVCTGDSVTLTWQSGYYDDECSFLITDYNGDTLAECSHCEPDDQELLAAFLPVCPSNCAAPAVSAQVIDYQSAAISWSSSAQSFEYAVKAAAATEWPEPTATAATAATLTGLQPETSYQVRVRAVCDEATVSGWGYATFTTDSLPCMAPEALAVAEVTNATATLTWTPLSAETSWQIRYAAQGNTYDTTVSAIPATLTGLLVNVTYTAWVRALCGDGTVESDWSEPVEFTTVACPVPTDLTLGQVTGSTAEISWNAPAEGYNDFVLSYGTTENLGNMTHLDVTGTTYTLSGLTAGEVYFVILQTKCAEGWTSNGTESISFRPTVGIDHADATAITLYPNPATDQVTIEGYQGEVQIVDMTGRTKFVFHLGQGNTTIDISSLTAGAYFVKLGTTVKKLIVK